MAASFPDASGLHHTPKRAGPARHPREILSERCLAGPGPWGKSLAIRQKGNPWSTVAANSVLPARPDAREIADHEKQVDQPECEPDGRGGEQPDREEDQTRSQEQQHASDQPEAIASTGTS